MKLRFFGALFLIVITINQVSAIELISPCFNDGDSWKVRVYTRQYQDDSSFSSRYKDYQYSVSNIDDAATEVRYKVSIVSLADQNPEASFLYFDKQHQLLKVDIKTRVAGKSIAFVIDANPGQPFTTVHGYIPCDYPAFPLAGDQDMEFVTYRKITKRLKRKEIIKQRSTADGASISVTCTVDNDMLFSQVWKPGLPFPVYGENKNMRYELISEENNGD